MTTVKDEWVAAAMTDDQMVVELLLRLKHAGTVAAENPASNLAPMRWGIRQRRSRSSRFGGGVTLKKDADSVRGSPKTPLSWSGGSGSGGASASPSAEDTSRQASCSTSTGSGSKAFPTNEITSCFPKRLKDKKSTSELKHEENLKLKERLHLEKEIASLRATFDQQNVMNQRLKRIKLDLNSGNVKNETPVDLIRKSQGESKPCRIEGKTASSESLFFLPDLNITPSEDELLYGTS
ncbi:BnaA03g51890D [Brassica napus]|uniref:BnaA03g51890D protein n=3 Tax=Brassica TaxID=3705 RepID=A0A078FJY4_BRANA|nr:BnaA03g51890D [Brassica napus]